MYGSAQDVVPVDPSSADVRLTSEAYAIRVVTAGNVAVQTRAGADRIMPFLAGETRQVCTGYFYKIGTTATGIEAFISSDAVGPNVIPSDSMTQAGDIVEGNPE